jgi:peptidoglycan/xylan/chitin deacetylase (PgdA/CDA1 family)
MVRRQDIAALLFYYSGYSGALNLALRLRRKPVTRIITLHDIQPESFDNFRANLIYLKQRTHVIDIRDYFAGRLSMEKINIIITFDDGYQSWLTYAVPALKQMGLPATFFVTTGFVGLSKAAESEFIRSRLLVTTSPLRLSGGLKEEEVRRIAEEGFTLGGHTLSHCNLGRPQEIGQIRYEIAEDKLRLERITHANVEFFAYPSGAHDNPRIDLIEVLKEVGYKGAVTAEPGFNSEDTNPYLLRRDLTGDSMPAQVFRARVSGSYDPVLAAKKLVRGLFHFS